MKNIIIIFFILLVLPAALYSQYTGGDGRGAVALALNGKHLTNWFNTDGNWGTATNWLEAALPTSSEDANVMASATVDGAYSHTGLTITSDGSVTIPSGKSLTVTGALTNSNPAGGLLVKSGGSLIQNSANVEAYVERDIAAWGVGALANHGWHFLSSPVEAQTIDPTFTDPDPALYDFFAWWEPTNEWVNFKNTGTTPTWNDANENSLNFIPGKGYLVEYATDAIGIDSKQFSGTLNYSSITVSNLGISTGTNNGWHLLGNPFTSALKWNDGNWALSNITATAKIWNEANASYTSIAYDFPPYSDIIPALNGFMVEVTNGTNSLTIPTAARVHNATAWYKSSEDPSILLVANDLTGQTAQESIIRFDNAATTGFDPAFDSHFLPGYAPLFYSVAGDDQLSTNALPESGGNVQVPFDFIKNEGVNFTIEAKTISDIQGPVILNDLKTGASQDLTINRVFSFTSATGDNPNRFLITFSHVGIGKTTTLQPISVYTAENTIYISSKTGTALAGDVYVYNMMGQLIMQQKLNGSNLTKISLNVSAGYYLVKVITGENVYSGKVFIN